jgi:hypothetical protein
MAAHDEALRYGCRDGVASLHLIESTLARPYSGYHRALKLEDTRLPMMIRQKTAPQKLQPFAYLKPAVGQVLLWESWPRHEVPMSIVEEERISVSFNDGWG